MFLRIYRTSAVNKLGEALQAEYKNVAAPNQRLLKVLENVAKHGDKSGASLTKTWQAASEIIQAHIHAFDMSPENQKKYFESTAKYIENEYLPKEHHSSAKAHIDRTGKDAIGSHTAAVTKPIIPRSI